MAYAQVKPKSPIPPMLVENVNIFGELEGFEIILSLLSSIEELESVNRIIKPFREVQTMESWLE